MTAPNEMAMPVEVNAVHSVARTVLTRGAMRRFAMVFFGVRFDLLIEDFTLARLFDRVAVTRAERGWIEQRGFEKGDL